MPRYIDADKLKERILRIAELRKKDHDDTCDLLFKEEAEVEQLQRNLEQCENGYKQQIHIMECKHKDEVEEAKQEVAREILDKICFVFDQMEMEIEDQIEEATHKCDFSIARKMKYGKDVICLAEKTLLKALKKHIGE